MPLDLNRLFLSEGHDLNFFQAVHLLERLMEGYGRPGTGDDLASEPVRFETLNSLAFPSSDVASVMPPLSLQKQAEVNSGGRADPLLDAASHPLARMPKEGRGPLRMALTFMGLYGVSSPLPAYFVDPITLRKMEYFELKKFLDIFSHRLYSLFYRSWKKYRHYAQFQPEAPDDYTLRLLALTGQWPRRKAKVRGAGESSDHNLRRIPYGRYLGNRVRSAKGLEQLLRGYFGFARVKVRQFTPAWVDIPVKTRLGLGGTALGRSARIGDRMLDRVSRFTVEIGPLDRSVFERFLPTPEAVAGAFSRAGKAGTAAGRPELLEQVKDLIEAYLRDPIDYDVKALLEPEPGVAPALGTAHARMGMGIWLGPVPRGEVACTL